MGSTRSFVFEFAWKVFVPSLTAAAAIAVFLLHLMYGIFDEANRLDQGYARRSAAAALQSLRDGVAEATKGGTPPADASFLVDATGRTIAAEIAGRPSGLTARDFLGRTFDVIIGGTSPVFFMSGGDLALAAAVPAGGGLSIAARKIGPGILRPLARQFAIGDLRFATPGQKGIDIFSATGTPIATFQWSERNPGNAAYLKYRDTITAALTTFMFVVGLLIYMSWRGFKEAHESKARAIAASLRDDLTGLDNRRSAVAALQWPLEQLRATGAGLSLVYADLDRFKEVNDAYGHEVGNQLLRAVAAGFECLAADRHLVARFGGDEFAMIAVGTDHESAAQRLADNMIAFLGEPIVLGGRVVPVSVSIGIVHLTETTADAEEVLRRADVAMYAAKKNGRNRVHIYDAALDLKRDENRAIADQLRAVLEHRQLRVVYQPIFDARTRRIAAVEALARWPAGSGRQLSPDVFIPIAEEFGLIEDLGSMVLAEACQEAANWPDITVAVNVSPIQFMNPAFPGLVEQTLISTGLTPNRLELEVTEGLVIDNAERTTDIIERLHAIGVSVALDDFGTGYSSIGHLRRFKFDKLKLDRSLVQDILLRPASLRLVQGTVAMAEALGMRVTAEGIEDEDQVGILRLAGCSQLQGYLFSKPLEASEIAAVFNPLATAISG